MPQLLGQFRMMDRVVLILVSLHICTDATGNYPTLPVCNAAYLMRVRQSQGYAIVLHRDASSQQLLLFFFNTCDQYQDQSNSKNLKEAAFDR